MLHLKTLTLHAVLVEHLQKTKKRIKTESWQYIYQNQLDNTCFQHYTAYWDFKDLTRRTASHKVFLNKAFNIAKNPKYDKYRCWPASMVYKFFDKKSASLTQSKTSAARASRDRFASSSGIKIESRKKKNSHLL